MGRNRKIHSSGLRLAPAAKALVLCLLLGASSVGYVLQKNKIYELGRQIREREIRLSQLKTDNSRHQAKLAEVLSPRQVQLRLKQLQLDMTLPQPTQMVWLVEPTLNNNKTGPQSPLLVWGDGNTKHSTK